MRQSGSKQPLRPTARPNYVRMFLLGVVGGAALGVASALTIGIFFTIIGHGNVSASRLATGLFYTGFATLTGFFVGFGVGLATSLAAMGLTRLMIRRFPPPLLWLAPSAASFVVVGTLACLIAPITWGGPPLETALIIILPFLVAPMFAVAAAGSPHEAFDWYRRRTTREKGL
jgi:hypothetical protein